MAAISPAHQKMLAIVSLFVVSCDVAQHLIGLNEYLSRCVGGGISFKLSECHVGRSEVKHLGHRINKDGHTMEIRINDTVPPRNLEETRSGLYLYAVYLVIYAGIVEELLLLIFDTCAM